MRFNFRRAGRILAVLGLTGMAACGGKERDTDSGVEVGPCTMQVGHQATEDAISVQTPACGGVVFDTFEVFGEGIDSHVLFSDGEMALPKVRVGTAGGHITAVHWKGRWWSEGGAAPVLLRQGYQSWSASGVFPLEGLSVEYDPLGFPAFGGDDGVTEVSEETPWSSWWMGMVGRSDGGVVGVGALSSQWSKVVVSFEPDGTAHVVWGGHDQRIELGPNDDVYLDPIWLGLGPDANALSEDYGARVAAQTPPRSLPEVPPVGWSTWYQYYEEVTEAEVRANLEQAVALRDGGAAFDVIQIDDGWSVNWGEWRENDRFPSGMEALASDIAAAGFTPGLWLAPLHMDRSNATYLDNPDWWLRDRAGVEVVWNDRAILDVTHPDARDWLAGLIRGVVQQGYPYLKLDFLFAGALDGQRHEPMTGMQAYALAMETIRDAAGDGTWVLACGAPLLPSVGWSDSMRTGPDIAFTLDRDPRQAYLRNQVRSTTVRNFTNGLWWWTDPDNLILRDPFTEAQARGAAVANAISGGVWMYGDDLTAWTDSQQAAALGGDLVDLRGIAAVPERPLAFVSGFDTAPAIEFVFPDDDVPQRWVFPTGEVALLNLTDAVLTLEGPGGVELLTGESASAGPRQLEPGEGEVWRPVP